LFRCRFAKKSGGQGLPFLALVTQFGADAEISDQSQQVVETPPWKGYVPREQLGAGNDARFAKRRHPHRLRRIEFRVLSRAFQRGAIADAGPASVASPTNYSGLLATPTR
jgi:hypothetical protein